MRDEPFFVAEMRDGRKFEGKMRECISGVGGRREVVFFHGGIRKLLIFFFFRETGCEKQTQVFPHLQRFIELTLVRRPIRELWK